MVAEGTPEDVAKSRKSYTGKVLRKVLKEAAKTKKKAVRRPSGAARL